jgi:methionyl-tRNA formyltransferase
MKILFLGKKDDPHGLRARDFCQRVLGETSAYFSSWGDALPEDVRRWRGDLIIGYLGRWIVPPDVVGHATHGAINFHAGPPEYPGIGCQNFALYEGAGEYGVVCHHMSPDVDTGQIIAVSRFAMFEADDVSSLLVRSYDYMLTLFHEVMSTFAATGKFPVSSESWKRKAFTRKELNDLSVIPLDASREEIARRRRALTFGVFAPYIELHGVRFYPED